MWEDSRWDANRFIDTIHVETTDLPRKHLMLPRPIDWLTDWLHSEPSWESCLESLDLDDGSIRFSKSHATLNSRKPNQDVPWPSDDHPSSSSSWSFGLQFLLSGEKRTQSWKDIVATYFFRCRWTLRISSSLYKTSPPPLSLSFILLKLLFFTIF